MTPLRQRMLDAMLQRGFAQRTQGCYIEAIARMARHYARGPALLTPEEVSAYLLHLVKDRKLSFSTVNQCASASRFLFETVLGRQAAGHLRPQAGRRVRYAGLRAGAQSVTASSLHIAVIGSGAGAMAWLADQLFPYLT